MKFNEQKVTEAAVFLLGLRGGRMHYLKLLKLLYIADREALHRWGTPITYDRYVSMDHGPVLSQTFNLIRDGGSRIWSEHISPSIGDYEVELISEIACIQKLSPAEERLLGEVFQSHGHMNRWDLIEEMHTYPEWCNPHGSSLPISLRAILEGIGEPEEVVAAIESELQTEEQFDMATEAA